MAIPSTDLSAALSQLARRPSLTLPGTAGAPTASQPVSSSDAGQNTPEQALPAHQQSNIGSGLKLSLTLHSGQDIDLSIRLNQTGGISQLQLNSDTPLSDDDQQKLQDFLAQLSDAVGQLFQTDQSSSNGLFDFANMDGIEDIDLDLYQDNGYKKQILEFDKEGSGSDKKVEAELYRYNRSTGAEDQHNLKLSKQSRNDNNAYGGMNYQWLFQQVDQALNVLGDSAGGEQNRQSVAAFFKSGIRALFETANSGHELLQQLGASAEQSRQFIGRSINVLANEHKASNLADFKADFSSQRHIRGQGEANGNYELALQISQLSHSSYDQGSDSTLTSQNRRLRLEYESAERQAIFEYTWVRDESLREVKQQGQLQSSHYRLDELIQARTLDGSKNTGLHSSTEHAGENTLRQDHYYQQDNNKLT